jgi:L-rhamnose mutarotase
MRRRTKEKYWRNKVEGVEIVETPAQHLSTPSSQHSQQKNVALLPRPRDLKPDSALIAEYEAYHRAVWPEMLKSIRDAGIESLEIYRVENRLFMILEAEADFSFEKKGAMDAANPKVQEWETLMWRYQQALPGTKPGEKWRVMEKIFEV